MKLELLEPFRHRSFGLLVSGQFVSMLGDQAYIVALAWQVQVLNPAPEALGLVLASYSVAQLLFLLIAGAIVDRLPRRTVLLVSDISRAVLVLLIAYLGREGFLEVWHLVVLSAFFGAVAAFFLPARSSIQPQLLPKEALLAGNSLMTVAFQSSLITGPLLGAILIENFAPSSAFAFDALTFAVSGSCLLFIRSPQDKPSRSGRNFLEDAKAGFSYIRHSVWLWLTILLFGLLGITLIGPVQGLGPVLVHEKFGGAAQIFGLLLSVRSIAALAATFVVGHFKQLRPRGLVAYLSVALSGLGVALLGLGGNFGWLWLCLFGIGCQGIGFACFDIIWTTVIQELVPAEYLGRVLSLDMLGSFCMIPVGLALAGLLAGVWGASAILLVGGLLSFALTMVGLLVPEIRRLA